MKNSELIEALSKLPPDLEVLTFDDGEWRGLTGLPKIGWVGPTGFEEHGEPTEGGTEVILLDGEWDGDPDHVRGMG
jgi:hypothetical protein